VSKRSFGAICRLVVAGALLGAMVPGLAGASPSSTDVEGVTSTDTLASPAEDGSEGISAPSGAGPALVLPGTVLWFDQFNDLSNWDASDYTTTPWVLGGFYIVYSPPTAAEMIMYENNEDAWLEQAVPLDFSAARAPVLRWRMVYHTEQDKDFISAGVKYLEGEEWVYETLGSWSGGEFSYPEFEADLAAYSGMDEVYLWYSFQSDEANTLEGACVDDVYVWDLNPTAAEAVADAYSGTEDTQLTVAAPGVLGNDTDAEGNVLAAVKKSDAAHGTVDLAADGSFTYTPDSDWSGIDSFTYAADDGAGESVAVTVTITVAPATDTITIGNADAGVTFGRFFTGTSTAYSGGSYVYAYSKAPFVGTRLEARFYGDQVKWMGPKQPVYGKAKVYIDGVYKQTVDCYAPEAEATTSAVIYDSGVLATDGAHTISIEMIDGKNPASRDSVVVIDHFEVSGDDPHPAALRLPDAAGTFLGNWMRIGGNHTYTDGVYAYSYWLGHRYRVTFEGTNITWLGPKVYNYGRAALYLDGAYKGIVSQYAPASSISFRAKVWESPTLASGTHTLEIRPLAVKDAASSASVIVIDGFDVAPGQAYK